MELLKKNKAVVAEKDLI